MYRVCGTFPDPDHSGIICGAGVEVLISLPEHGEGLLVPCGKRRMRPCIASFSAKRESPSTYICARRTRPTALRHDSFVVSRLPWRSQALTGAIFETASPRALRKRASLRDEFTILQVLISVNIVNAFRRFGAPRPIYYYRVFFFWTHAQESARSEALRGTWYIPTLFSYSALLFCVSVLLVLFFCLAFFVTYAWRKLNRCFFFFLLFLGFASCRRRLRLMLVSTFYASLFTNVRLGSPADPASALLALVCRHLEPRPTAVPLTCSRTHAGQPSRGQK